MARSITKGVEHMQVIVVLKRGEDGYFVAECPTMPGCVSQGETKEQAIENIREAISLYLETIADMGISPQYEYEFVEV